MKIWLHIPGIVLCIYHPFSFSLLEQTPLSPAFLGSPLPFLSVHSPCAQGSLSPLLPLPRALLFGHSALKPTYPEFIPLLLK